MRIGVGNAGATLTIDGAAKTTGSATTRAGGTEMTIGKNGAVRITGGPNLGKNCGTAAVAETLDFVAKTLDGGRPTMAVGPEITTRLWGAAPPDEARLGIRTSATAETIKKARPSFIVILLYPLTYAQCALPRLEMAHDEGRRSGDRVQGHAISGSAGLATPHTPVEPAAGAAWRPASRPERPA